MRAMARRRCLPLAVSGQDFSKGNCMTPASRLTGLLTAVAIGLAGCGEPDAVALDDGSPSQGPQRIVSLDYCADQYVLKFVDRDRILALSPDADADFSYMRDAAAGLPTIRPIAEDALLLKPDLIVRSYGGGPNATAFFKRAGVPVLNVGWANDLEGVKNVIMDMASGFGEEARGRDVVAEMEARLAAISKRRRSSETALYVTSGGVTTGSGSLMHEALEAAGFKNFEEASGWRAIPLERLAYEQPDVIAAAFFDTYAHHMGPWSAARHPLVRAQLRERKNVTLDAAWTSCTGWFLVDAIEALAVGAPSQTREGERLED